jgi:hypothetical protein
MTADHINIREKNYQIPQAVIFENNAPFSAARQQLPQDGKAIDKPSCGFNRKKAGQ